MALLQSSLGFSRDHWETFAELGWLGAALPEHVDGFGGSAVESAIILEEFGRALVVEPYLSCAVLALQAINQSGDDARLKFLPAAMNGRSIFALAHSEPDSAARGKAIETRARASDHCGFLLNGRKSFVLAGSAADKLLVSATTSGESGGLTLFAIDQNAPGLQRNEYRLIDGTRACDITLQNVPVCKEALVGTEGEAFPAIEIAFDHAVVCSCAEALGAMEGVLAATAEFLKGRDQSGAPLSTYQALQHRMADMLVEVELARSAMHMGLSALEQKDQRLRQKGVSACKVQVSQSAKFVGTNGIQLHGAIGLSNEHRIGQYFKRMTVLNGIFGGIDFHLERFLELA
jgi:alkylation response protein AidB-like acyl-CoA dehydrogenase